MSEFIFQIIVNFINQKANLLTIIKIIFLFEEEQKCLDSFYKSKL
jgi:hypothetical protein